MKPKPKSVTGWGVFTKGGKFLAAHKNRAEAKAYSRRRLQHQRVVRVRVEVVG